MKYIHRSEEMTRVAEVPLSRPVANKRSPNRKPRIRRQTLMALKIGHQEAFLELIRVGETRAGATRRVGIAPQTVDGWMAENKEFVQHYREAQAESRAFLEGRRDALLPMALDVAEETMEHRDVKTVKVAALRWDAAHKLMRGSGILRDVDQHAILGDIVLRVKYDDDSKQGTNHSSKELPASSSSGPVS